MQQMCKSTVIFSVSSVIIIIIIRGRTEQNIFYVSFSVNI